MILATTVGIAPQLYAQSGTAVSANVCGLNQTASIVISSPRSGTSTSVRTVTVTGALTQITQLTAFIDDQFSEIIPIDSNAQTFSYEYMPPVGQHTLRLEGQDLCQRTTPVAELVLTYDPALPVTPITGPATPPTPPAVGSRPVETPPITPPGLAKQIDGIGEASTVLPGIFRSAGNSFAEALMGLGIVSNNSKQSVVMATRFALVTTGTMVVTLAGGALKLSALLLPAAAKNGLLAVTPTRLATHPRFAISLVGLALVAMGFLLPN